MNKLITSFIALLLLPLASLGQSWDQYNNENLVDYKIYREHIPLDGSKVKYIPFRQDSLYGFVEPFTMKFVIKPRFSQVFAIYPEGAIVEFEQDRYKGYGVVDYSDSFIIPPVFTNLFKEGNVYHGLFNGHDKTEEKNSFTSNYYFDEKGKKLFETRSHRQGSFNETDSFAWFRYKDDYTIYDRKGKLRKTFKQDKSNRFVGIFNNVLVFDKEEKGNPLPHVFIGMNIKGKEVFRLRPKSHTYINGLIQMNENLYCAMDARSEAVIFITKFGDELSFDINNGTTGFGFKNMFPYFQKKQALEISNGERKYGMLSKDGHIILHCDYQYLGEEENGEFAYYDLVKHAIGFMNLKGEVVVPPKLDAANEDRMGFGDYRFMYSEGLCVGREHKTYTNEAEARKAYEEEEADSVEDYERDQFRYRYLYYDRNGEKAITLPDSIILAHHFSGGLAAVVARKSRGLGFIDKTGKLVIPTKYAVEVAGAYPLPYVVVPEFKNGFAYLKAFKGYIDDKGNEYFAGKHVRDHYDFSH